VKGFNVVKDGSQQERIAERLAGHHILVTGSTGFLAKAFIEKLLRAVDTIGGIHLLVRSRTGGTTPRQRVMREVLGSRAFDRLRASLGEGFARLCDEKIHVVRGDLTQERLGLTREEYDALAERITLVVNSAATVTFDERIDLAVELNTMGPGRLLQLANDAGQIPFTHVSTCYVCGARRGVAAEDFSAPPRAVETLPRLSDGTFDLEGLVDSLRAEAAQLRHRFGADTETCRRQLIKAGMDAARAHGWNDTYTFTKWIGEQLLVRDHGPVPLTVFRPAIIEGSFEEPTPGWIDGLRMADPIIIAYGRGKLEEFPGIGSLAIDLIPVDFVANAMIATLPVGDGRGGKPAVYHCASSYRNPFYLKEMRKALIRAFDLQPMSDDAGRPIRPRRLALADREAFAARWRARHRRVARLQKVLSALGIRGRRYRRLSAALRQIDQLLYFSKIYSPYTHFDCRFADESLQETARKLHPDDRAEFPFDAARVDWEDYLVNRHVPGLRAFVLGSTGDATPRILATGDWDVDGAAVATEALRGTSLFDVFRRAAERFGNKPALQVRRDGRWIRYTFDEAVRATGLIARRFDEYGLRPGDRIALCGDSGPEWGLAYLAAMRAGLTVAPLDPQLPPAEAWASARFAEAKLMCVTPSTATGLLEHRSEHDPEVVTLRESFIPRPGASREAGAEPVPVDDSAIASILFTSGTTVAPKAVLLTHRNLMANAAALVRVHPANPSDEMLSVLPMYHAFEFTGGFLVPLLSGATITYVEQLKGPEIVSAMQATGTTIMLVVPRLLRLFHDSIRNNVAASGPLTRALFRVSGFLASLTGHRFGRILYYPVHRRFGGRLRMFVCGGSRLDPELFASFRRMGFPVYEGYGLTETAPVLTVNPAGRARPGSVGLPLPGIDIEIRRPDADGVGEVWVRGPNVMSGYLKNRKATEAVLVNGWLRTGDLGHRDPDGYLYLTGRSTDLMVTDAGKNVYPDEVEARYADLPHVNEMCVFGIPSADGRGDLVQAVMVISEESVLGLDRSSLEREIRTAAAAVSESLPSHQRIRTIHFWDRELPKTSTLKAKRTLIRQLVLAEQDAQGSEPGGVAHWDSEATASEAHAEGSEGAAHLDVVRSILTRQTRRPAHEITPSMHLHLDLGIDSIGKMDVLAAIESLFDFQIDGTAAASIVRVADLLNLLGRRTLKTRASRSASMWQRQPATAGPASIMNGRTPAHLLPLRWLVRGGANAFMSSYVRVRVQGRRHLPVRGAFILAPNHSSHLDSPSVLKAVAGRRRVWVVGAEDYFFNTRIKRLVFGRLLDTIPFDRHADGIMGLRRCGQALDRGDGLLIFPEGTRSTEGQIQPFKIGVAVLAMDRRVPIVPVHIDRAYDLFPKGSRFVRPGVITVSFGPPIHPPEPPKGMDRHDAYRALAREVEQSVVALVGEAQR
jgi:long-chain acyl-CoA synthetase